MQYYYKKFSAILFLYQNLTKYSLSLVTATDEVIRWFKEVVGIKINDTTADNHFNILRTSYVDACNIDPMAKLVTLLIVTSP